MGVRRAGIGRGDGDSHRPGSLRPSPLESSDNSDISTRKSPGWRPRGIADGVSRAGDRCDAASVPCPRKPPRPYNAAEYCIVAWRSSKFP